jgi:hypothetical protein
MRVARRLATVKVTRYPVPLFTMNHWPLVHVASIEREFVNIIADGKHQQVGVASYFIQRMNGECGMLDLQSVKAEIQVSNGKRKRNTETLLGLCDRVRRRRPSNATFDPRGEMLGEATMEDVVVQGGIT